MSRGGGGSSGAGGSSSVVGSYNGNGYVFINYYVENASTNGIPNWSFFLMAVGGLALFFSIIYSYRKCKDRVNYY